MTADEEKYKRLMKCDKVMIIVVTIICVIIMESDFLKINLIIIPLVLASTINFMLDTVLSFFEKKIFPVYYQFRLLCCTHMSFCLAKDG